MQHMAQQDVNAFRFLVRGASAALTARIVEMQGGELKTYGSKPALLPPISVNSSETFNRLVVGAYQGQENIVYYSENDSGVSSRDYTLVLEWLSRESPSYTAGSVELPTVSKIWPDIERLRFVYMPRSEHDFAEMPALTSLNIENAMR